MFLANLGLLPTRETSNPAGMLRKNRNIAIPAPWLSPVKLSEPGPTTSSKRGTRATPRPM